MNKNTLLSASIAGLFALLSCPAFTQIEPSNGVADSKVAIYALTDARIVVSSELTLEKGTLIIRGEDIVEVGKRVSIPDGAVQLNCEGLTILPGFIELSSTVGIPNVKSKKTGFGPQPTSLKKGAYYWNESIHPEVRADELYTPDAKASKNLIQSGFCLAVTHQKDGLIQGEGAVVSLGENVHNHLTDWANPSFLSFQKGVSQQSYPSSQMGVIALLRQAHYDASWYAHAGDHERNLSLEALNEQWNKPAFFYTQDKWEILRAGKIAREFDRTFHYFGSGNEYGILDELKEMVANVIVPIHFPKAYDVENPYVARQIPLSDLKHWELAPMNPGILEKNGISFCISSEGHKTANDFWKHLRTAIQHGLSKQVALEALTSRPANLLGISHKAGTLEAGKKACFTMYSDDPFSGDAKLLESWFLGERNLHDEVNPLSIQGKYRLKVGERSFQLDITQNEDKYSGEVLADTTDIKATVHLDQEDVTIRFACADSWNGMVLLRGKVRDKFGVFEGEGMIPTGEWVDWTAIRSEKGKKEPKTEEGESLSYDSLVRPWFPNMAYGLDSIPEQEIIVIRNATLWTNEADGILKDGTVVIENGKITYCGNGHPSPPGGARTIDAKGRHLTSGIIDEHSHIAIWKGVNEGGQAISAEVSIGDVVHPDDINIYRQLSGGVTTAQLLHGSANPIGGQSALIKLKWGGTPEDMLIDNAPKFIKCALGENVKQSNWGDHNKVRFPQTRMGVEQVFYDGFSRARIYEEAKKAAANNSTLPNPRTDLELEALVEILNSERFITCHSYVQSEINMLMHIADSMDFRINTFTHILEGYKLADKMVAHGAGGSTFSDWWAYKYEVKDAIPYNAALMTEQGVVVAVNSDDAEMGRRLNQEAAKGVKYGGMSEEEAWKMVTLNPAKLLHLDDRMGSLKVGKDADVVLWSDNPLSVTAIADYTIVDGTILYDRSRNDELYDRNQAEKARIISKMLNANASGDKTPFQKKKKGHYHCNTLGEDASLEENHH